LERIRPRSGIIGGLQRKIHAQAKQGSTVQDSQQITPRILVTTDFTRESERAFHHALAFAVAKQARLTLLHTGSESRRSVPWDRFPGVRETLAGWGLLPADAPRSAVSEVLKLSVAKMAMRDDDPRQGITDYLRRHPTDLLVMATEGRTGLARLFNPSIAETVSDLTNSHTLMLPKQGRGFVDPETGKAELRRVLCALDIQQDPRPALSYLQHWLPALGGSDIEILLLHTCDPEQAPEVALARTPGLRWREEVHNGEPVELIVKAAREMEAELVVMSTHGRLGLLGRLRGSAADKAMRELQLPLLSIPLL
jgi:nucleotide-binding universal stress UspA family protein